MAGCRAVCIACLVVWGAIVCVFEVVCVEVDAGMRGGRDSR